MIVHGDTSDGSHRLKRKHCYTGSLPIPSQLPSDTFNKSSDLDITTQLNYENMIHEGLLNRVNKHTHAYV